MNNKEFQELIDNQLIWTLHCVMASVSKLNEENFDLQDKVYKLEEEIKRLTAESTKWESKFYDEVKKVDKAIKMIKDYLCSYDYTSAEFKKVDKAFERIWKNLEGEDDE